MDYDEILKLAADNGATEEELEKLAEYYKVVDYLSEDEETLNKYASAYFAGKLEAYRDFVNALNSDENPEEEGGE